MFVVAATFDTGASGLRFWLWATAALGALVAVVAIYSAIDPPGSAIFGGFGGSALHGSGLNANQRAVGILGGLVVAGPAGLAAFLASAALRSRARASSDGVDPWEPSSSSAPVQEPPGNGR